MDNFLPRYLCSLKKNPELGEHIPRLKTSVVGSQWEGYEQVLAILEKFFQKFGKYPGETWLRQHFKFLPELEEFEQGILSEDDTCEGICDLDEEVSRDRIMEAVGRSDWESIAREAAERTGARVTIEKYTAEHALEDYMKGLGQPSGILTGVEELDSRLRGLSFATTTIIAAPPSMFKSTMATQIAYENVFNRGFNIAYITLEIPKKVCWFNFLSRHSIEVGKPIPAQDIKKQLLDEAGIARLAEVVKHWEANCKGQLEILEIGDLGNGSYSDMARLLNRLNSNMPGGLDVVILDYVQLLKFFRQPFMDEIQYVNGMVRFLDGFSKAFNNKKGLINIVLSQINRQGQLKIARSNRADLTLLAEYNELERSAEVVIAHYADEGMRLGHQMKVQICKNRPGLVMEEMEMIYVDPAVGKVGTGAKDAVVSVEDLYLLDDE